MGREKKGSAFRGIQICFTVRPDILRALERARPGYMSRSEQIRVILESYLAKLGGKNGEV